MRSHSLPSSRSFPSFVLRSRGVRMQANRYRRFSLIKAFQSKGGGRDGGKALFLYVTVFFSCWKVSFQLRRALEISSILLFFQSTPVTIIIFVNYTLWRTCSDMTKPTHRPGLGFFFLFISGEPDTREASLCMLENHLFVCLSVHWHVFMCVQCLCVRCFWIDKTQPTVKTAFFHTADQSSLQLGHFLFSTALYFSLSPLPQPFAVHRKPAWVDRWGLWSSIFPHSSPTAGTHKTHKKQIFLSWQRSTQHNAGSISSHQNDLLSCELMDQSRQLR